MFDNNLEKVKRAVRGRQTPLLVIDRAVIRQRFSELKHGIGNARICYALKTNPHWRIVDLLREIGSDFEISSGEELNILLRRGISTDRIIASNPVKSSGFIRSAFAAGIQLFAFDSYDEIEKLSSCAPGSKVYVRLNVSNDGSQWPLSKKFGVETEDALALLREARGRGLQPYGLTFHVGSQNTDMESWTRALNRSKELWDSAGEQGIELRMLNIGGGFPIKYNEKSFSTGEIAGRIRETIDKLFPNNVEVFVEPGRVLVGEAGVLAGTVIGKAARNGDKWLYLDVGVFNGLMESIGGIEYPLVCTINGSLQKWVLAGPSCDSLDVIHENVLLPELDIGDNLFILSAGAYTTAYASRFDGAPIPRITFI